MPDEALQQRTGYNQGQQPTSGLTYFKKLGQPAIKLENGDTVLFRNSPQVPGESNPRSIHFTPIFVSGLLFNLSGGEVTLELVVIDDLGNEWVDQNSMIIADGNNTEIMLELMTGSCFCLLPGWSVVARVTAGNPTSGRGVVAWPFSHDLTRNVVAMAVPLSTTPVEIGPPKGRGWQSIANGFEQEFGFEIVNYANFDSVAREIDAEIMHLAGEDILVSNDLMLPLAPGADGGQADAFTNITDQTKAIILAYPDKIKIQAKENQTSGPLYFFANWAEFDLPRDMG